MDTRLSAAFWIYIVTQYYVGMENNKHMHETFDSIARFIEST